MECLYHPELDKNKDEIEISGEEFKHLKVLRLKINESIYITNGLGITITGKLIELHKNNAVFKIVDYFQNLGELDYRLGLAIGILSDRNRFEFALEKAVELGCTDFYSIASKFCEKPNINYKRLERKAIAAMKQSRRSKLIQIHNQMKLQELIKLSNDYAQIILADENSKNILETIEKADTLIIIGPEGGFDKEEIEFMEQRLEIKKINLGNRRLRAETAAIASLSLITNLVR